MSELKDSKSHLSTAHLKGDPVSKSELEQVFDDNQTPIGADFKSLIHSTVNLVDDGIAIQDDLIKIDKALEAHTKIEVIGENTGKTVLTSEALKIADNTALTADTLTVTDQVSLTPSSFKVGNKLTYQQEGQLEVLNSLTVGQEQDAKVLIATDPHTALRAEGNTQLNGELEVQQQVNIEKGLTVADSVHVSGKLQAKQDMQVSGELCAEAKAKLVGPVSIGIDQADHQALLNLEQADGSGDDLIALIGESDDVLIVDNQANLGLSHAEPKNKLDINGSVYLGESVTSVEPNHSLSVQGRIGVGTASPQARLDIKSEVEQLALSVRQNESALLSLKTGLDNAEAELNFSGSTELEQDLTVGKELKVAGRTVLEDELVVAKSAEFEGDIVANKDIDISGELDCSGRIYGQAELEIDGAATFTSEVTANGATQLDDSLTVKKQAELQANLEVKGDAEFAQTLKISADPNIPPRASLHVKEEASRPALAIDNNAGMTSVLLNQNQLTLGSADHAVSLDVLGHSNVAGQGSFKSGVDVAQWLVVDQTDSVSNHTAVKVVSSGDTNKALEVLHDTSALLVADKDKVGVLCANPESAFHVGGASCFDASVKVKSDFSVMMPDQHSTVLTAKQEGVAIGHANPEMMLDVAGDVKINGELVLHNWLTAKQSTLSIEQLGDQGGVHITQQGNKENKLMLTASGIAYNCDTAVADMHFNGTVKIDQRSELADLTVNNTLTVAGAAEFNSDLKLYGPVKVNRPGDASDCDFHLRQSTESTTAFRIDHPTFGRSALVVKSGKIGINNDSPEVELDVAGHANINGELTLSGKGNFASEVEMSDRLTVQGATECNATLNVAKDFTARDRLTVHGSSHFNDQVTIKEQTALRDNLLIDKNIGLSVDKPAARIHLNIDDQQTALRIDSPDEELTHFAVRHGKVGIGIAEPKHELDVVGDTLISDELTVCGRTHLESTLDVAQDTLIKSDLTVKEKSRLKEQTILGQLDDAHCDDPIAQLYIADSRYAEALRIDSTTHASLVVRDGKLGIGVEQPNVELDIGGAAKIAQSLDVAGNAEIVGTLKVEDNLKAFGTLDVSQKAKFASDVTIKGDLCVEDKTDIDEELTVTGDTLLKAKLTVNKKTSLNSELTVHKTAEFKASAHVDGVLAVNGDLSAHKNLNVIGDLSSGVEVPAAKLHLQSKSDQNALLLEKKLPGNDTQCLLKVNEHGHFGVGVEAPQAALDVSGDAKISGEISTDRLVVDTQLTASTASIKQSLKLANGPKIHAISEDTRLGGDAGLNSVLPTQAAVKAYVDSVAVPFARGGKTHIVSSQADFDRVFNLHDTTTIAEGTCIILMPLSNSDFGTQPYVLKSSVSLKSKISIVGFNPATTQIKKHHANARFELIGSSDNPITEVHLDGFTFDGAGLECTRSGGAFYLAYVKSCKLNCRIQHHKTWGDGGAIYGMMQPDRLSHTVSEIEALHIYHCTALDQGSGSDTELNEGGAAYGLNRSRLNAYHCMAEQGGAVSYCDESHVEATKCHAKRNGGAAFRCSLLRLTARECSADMSSGKGGGAYFCSDLICEGCWVGNNAAEAPHIYASNHLTGEQEERHYWKGDYVGRRIDDDVSVWRAHNE